MLSLVITALLLPLGSLALPQATTTASAASSGTTHVVTVGADSRLAFNPNNITAAQGDTVVFEFGSPGHSVTQSSFAAPCTPLLGGLTSAFSTSNTQTFAVTVTDATTPLWFFCDQTDHCESGMAFSINAPAAPAANDQAAFLSAAEAASPSSPSIDGVVSAGVGVVEAAAAAPASSSSTSATSTPTSSSSTSAAVSTSSTAAAAVGPYGAPAPAPAAASSSSSPAAAAPSKSGASGRRVVGGVVSLVAVGAVAVLML